MCSSIVFSPNYSNYRKLAQKHYGLTDEQDALAMVALDSHNRTYTRNKFLMGPVFDIEMPKALPTTNIAVSNVQEYVPQQQQLGQIKLPDRQQEPFRV